MAERGETRLVEALRRHVEALAVEIGPRTPLDGDSLDRAAAYIRSSFEEMGLSVSEQSYDYCGKRVANIVAAPARQDASAFYVAGAHYDTVEGTPGADDNASAVAVLLELARRRAEAQQTLPIRFVAFTLEEPPAFSTGHQGSRFFVERCRESEERVLGAIVLEMVGYTSDRQRYPFLRRWPFYPSKGNFIGIVGSWRSRRFARKVLKGFRKNRRLPVASLILPFDGRMLPETRWSDHASFWDAGLPALMVTDTAFFRNPHYHLPSDTIDTLDFGFMAKLVLSLDLALDQLADAMRRG